MKYYEMLDDEQRAALDAHETAAYRLLQDDKPEEAARAMAEARERLAELLLTWKL